MFVNERGGRQFRTVDYERDAVLKTLSGHPDRRHPFELRWRGHRFEFAATPHNYIDPISGSAVLSWDIYEIIPDFASAEQASTVKALIVDALRVHKDSYGIGRSEKVEVTFSGKQPL